MRLDCAEFGACWQTKTQVMAFATQITTRNFDSPYNFQNDCASIQSSCDYNTMYNYLSSRTCNPSCDKCVNAYGTCFHEAPWPGCDYAFGPGRGECILCPNYNIYTFCSDSCTRAMPEHPVSWFVCYPATDTSSASSPGVMYVTSTGNGKNAGTWTDPYHQLASAFAQNYEAYTTIYLLLGIHQLRCTDVASLEGLLIENSCDVLTNGYSNAHLLITTLMCTGSNDHPECSSSRVTLHIADATILFSVKSQITISNVMIDGTSQLPPVCPGDLCSYCPLVEVNEDGALMTDQGEQVTSGAYTLQTTCNAYHDTVLFKVDISNIRYQLKAVIYNLGGVITLSAVTFTNIIPSISSGAVIMQETCASSYGCGSLTYTSGTVSYLNNGYEVTSSLKVGGFLYATRIRRYRLSFS